MVATMEELVSTLMKSQMTNGRLYGLLGFMYMKCNINWLESSLYRINYFN